MLENFTKQELLEKAIRSFLEAKAKIKSIIDEIDDEAIQNQIKLNALLELNTFCCKYNETITRQEVASILQKQKVTDQKFYKKIVATLFILSKKDKELFAIITKVFKKILDKTIKKDVEICQIFTKYSNKTSNKQFLSIFNAKTIKLTTNTINDNIIRKDNKFVEYLLDYCNLISKYDLPYANLIKFIKQDNKIYARLYAVKNYDVFELDVSDFITESKILQAFTKNDFTDKFYHISRYSIGNTQEARNTIMHHLSLNDKDLIVASTQKDIIYYWLREDLFVNDTTKQEITKIDKVFDTATLEDDGSEEFIQKQNELETQHNKCFVIKSLEYVEDLNKNDFEKLQNAIIQSKTQNVLLEAKGSVDKKAINIQQEIKENTQVIIDSKTQAENVIQNFKNTDSYNKIAKIIQDIENQCKQEFFNKVGVEFDGMHHFKIQIIEKAKSKFDTIRGELKASVRDKITILYKDKILKENIERGSEFSTRMSSCGLQYTDGQKYFIEHINSFFDFDFLKHQPKYKNYFSTNFDYMRLLKNCNTDSIITKYYGGCNERLAQIMQLAIDYCLDRQENENEFKTLKEHNKLYCDTLKRLSEYQSKNFQLEQVLKNEYEKAKTLQQLIDATCINQQAVENIETAKKQNEREVFCKEPIQKRTLNNIKDLQEMYSLKEVILEQIKNEPVTDETIKNLQCIIDDIEPEMTINDDIIVKDEFIEVLNYAITKKQQAVENQKSTIQENERKSSVEPQKEKKSKRLLLTKKDEAIMYLKQDFNKYIKKVHTRLRENEDFVKIMYELNPYCDKKYIGKNLRNKISFLLRLEVALLTSGQNYNNIAISL